MHLVVYLAADTKDETALATYQSFLHHCHEHEHSEHLEIKIITPEQLVLEKSTSESREISLAKALEKIIHAKKVEKAKNKKEEFHHHHQVPKIFILQNYPLTEEEMIALMDSKFKYPILDAVIKFVNRTDTPLISSEGGPPSTIPHQPEDQPKPPELFTNVEESEMQTKKHLLSELDLFHFLEKIYPKHSGHITYDEINAVKASGDAKTPWVVRDCETLFDEFSVLTSALAESKHVFRDWAAQTYLVDVKHDAKAAKRISAAKSGDLEIWKSEQLYSSYAENINSIPTDLQTPYGIMYSMILAVAGPEEDDSLGFIHQSYLISPPKSPPANKELNNDNESEHGGLNPSPSDNRLLSDLIYEPSVPAVPEPILVIEEGDRCAIRAILARRHTLASDAASQLSDNPESNGSPRAASPVNDFRPVITVAGRKKCLDLISFESTAIFHSQVPRLVGQTALPLKPAYNRIERSVMESELLTFTELSASDVHRFNLLQTAENMVERVLPKLPNFTGQKIGDMIEISITKRHHFRHIPAATLSQQLARDIQADPVVLREYYPLTDQLLLSYIWIPPHRRLHQKEWKLSSLMRVKPTYEEFRILREKENYTPRTASGLKHTINITAAELEKHNFHRSVLTPSDNSIVALNATKATNDPWLSISLKDAMMGMRLIEKSKAPKANESEEHSPHHSHKHGAEQRNATFFLHSEDDVRITASIENIPQDRIRKPDGKKFVCTTITDLSGLTVTVNTNGIISITPTEIPGQRYPFGMERCRMIVTGGVVTRILASDYMYSRDIMMPDGSRIIIRGAELNGEDKSKKAQKPVKKSGSKMIASVNTKKGGLADFTESKETFISALIRDAPDDWSYLHLPSNGSVEFYQTTDSGPRKLNFDRVKNIRKSYIDGESKSEIVEFRDGRVIVNYANDDIREVRHVDGTRHVMQLQKQVVFIEKISSKYPTVEMDLEIDRMCRDHSRGIQVPIAKGGERVRSRLALADGTAILIKYNTRVTAQYNGSLRVVKKNRDSFLLEDGGILTFFPSSSWSSQNEKEFQEENMDTSQPRHTPYQTKSNLPATTLSAKSTKVAGGSLATSQSRGGISSRKPLPPTKALKSKSRIESAVLNPAESIPSSAPIPLSAGPPALTPLMELHTKIDNTKYIFRLAEHICIIEDHENNVFELDFQSPLEPKVALAGEVEGLKPHAITEKTLEAKVYVINRNGNAIQVVGNQEIEDLNIAMKLSPDSMKYVTEAHFPPCDLGGARLHTYFKRRRVGVEDSFTFNEIYAPRYWHNFELPTAALILLEKARKLPSNSALRQKVYEVRSMIEYPPLSQQGYEGLAASFKKWNKWRVERNTALDRFHFHDPRTEDDIKAEKEIASRLKKAYKAAKAMVNKKKEKEREKSIANQPPNSTNLDLTVIHEDHHLEDIPENSDYEDDDEDEEEVEFVEDPESVEIKESFENYAVLYEDNISRIPLTSLRSAFVQVFNRFIPEADIQRGLMDDIRSSASRKDSLTIEEYRRLYFKLKGPEGLENIPGDRNSVSQDRDSSFPAEVLSTTLPFTMTKPPSSSVAPGSFWKSKKGVEIEIQHRLNGADEEEESPHDMVTYNISGDNHAVGSALSAARNVNRSL